MMVKYDFRYRDTMIKLLLNKIRASKTSNPSYNENNQTSLTEFQHLEKNSLIPSQTSQWWRYNDSGWWTTTKNIYEIISICSEQDW